MYLFRNESGKMTELDTYAIPEAHDLAYASGFGDLSVHEVATSQADASLAYFSYYSAGLRVARIENDTLVEKGHFIDEGGSNLWGVETVRSRRSGVRRCQRPRQGLYIFRCTGD